MDIVSTDLFWYGFASIILILAIKRYSELSHVPGPFFAAFSDLPRLYWTWERKAHEKHIALHRKYGNLVRISPNMVSVGDVAELPHIYGIDETFAKVHFLNLTEIYTIL